MSLGLEPELVTTTAQLTAGKLRSGFVPHTTECPQFLQDVPRAADLLPHSHVEVQVDVTA